MPLRTQQTLFADRREAGRQLADRLHDAPRPDVILALPRGGVPVAFEVARALDVPLDLLIVRKISAPNLPEVGIGAVVDGASPQVTLNAEAVEMTRASDIHLATEKARRLDEIERYRARYLGDRPGVDVAGRRILLIDDGIATGSTAEAALKAMHKAGAARVTLAVPVASPMALEALRDLADDIVCLSVPADFGAVGSHYRHFDQTEDEEVVELLQQASRPDSDRS